MAGWFHLFLSSLPDQDVFDAAMWEHTGYAWESIFFGTCSYPGCFS